MTSGWLVSNGNKGELYAPESFWAEVLQSYPEHLFWWEPHIPQHKMQ